MTASTKSTRSTGNATQRGTAKPAARKMRGGPQDANPPAPELDNSLGAEVRDTYLAFKGAFHDRLRAHQITSAQWIFLRALWSDDGVNQKELARRVGVHPTTAVTAVDILAKHGYVRRERSETDRRNVTVLLTAQGRLLAHSLLPFAQELNRRAVQDIPAEDIARCQAVLARIRKNLQAG